MSEPTIYLWCVDDRATPPRYDVYDTSRKTECHRFGFLVAVSVAVPFAERIWSFYLECKPETRLEWVKALRARFPYYCPKEVA